MQPDVSFKPVYVLLGLMLLVMVSSTTFKTMTYDEGYHLRYAIKLLHLDPDREGIFEDSKMPFSILNAIPFQCVHYLLKYFNEGSLTATQRYLCYAAARSATMLFSLLLGIYVFRWSKELYGYASAIFSLVLYVFSPNILAHSRFITTDLYAALMVTVSTYYFWRFMNHGGRRDAIVSALALGISQLAKYTCLYLYPIYLAVVIIKYSKKIFGLLISRNTKELLYCLGVFFRYFVIYAAISLVVINSGFFFHKTFLPLDEYQFHSRLFKGIQTIPLLNRLMVPLPYPYVQGMDMVKYHEDTGRSFGRIYLLGKLKHIDENTGGIKTYYLYALLFKEPIASQIFILLALSGIVYKRKMLHIMNNEMYLIMTTFLYFLFFSMFFKAQIGIRYILPVLPLLYILCGNLFAQWNELSGRNKSFYCGMILYLILSSVSYYPHYLPYFNELSWDRKKAYRIMADSNLDWGQNRWYLSQYRKRHPEAIVSPKSPVSGRIVVSANELVGIFDPEKYRWLRETYEPVDHIAYSYLVFDVPAQK